MITGFILFLVCCFNVYSLHQLRKATRKLEETNAALLALTAHLQSKSNQRVVVEQRVTGAPVLWRTPPATH